MIRIEENTGVKVMEAQVNLNTNLVHIKEVV